MNIAQAKAIPLPLIVEHLGGRFSHKGTEQALWYFSPFRNEKTASFKIDERRNKWYDFGHVAKMLGSGTGYGGDGIDLWCEYHWFDRKTGVKEALQHLRGVFGHLPQAAFIQPVAANSSTAQDMAATQVPSRFKILKLKDRIRLPSLLEELNRRRIPLALAERYLKHAIVKDTQNPMRKFNGFAFINDKGGYELSCPNPLRKTTFKTSTKPKWFSTIQGVNNDTAEIFEGMWDFLSSLAMSKLSVPTGVAYVLNSLSFANALCENLHAQRQKIKIVRLYMDNDAAGTNATDLIIDRMSDCKVTIGTMEHLYRPHKDLSEYWVQVHVRR